MDAATPCRCPRCGWLGTIHDAEAYQPLAHLEPLNICPRCATETEVQPLGQKRASMGSIGSTPCC